MKPIRTVLAVLTAAACLSVVGCGDPPQPVESRESAVQIGGDFSLSQGFLQQVSLSCPATSCSNGGAYNNSTIYPMTWNTSKTFQVGNWQASLTGTSGAGPDIKGNTEFANLTNWSSGTSNTASNYFPSAWSLPQGTINYGLKLGASQKDYCLADGSWCRKAKGQYVYWFSDSGGVGSSGPTASTKYVVYRVDIDFPEYNLTDRWFYYFVR